MCHNKNILGWTDCREAPESLLNQCFTGSKDINELLGAQCATHWPETGANPSGHYDTVIVFIHLLLYKLNFMGCFLCVLFNICIHKNKKTNYISALQQEIFEQPLKQGNTCSC
jgi:hypothetical protein